MSGQEIELILMRQLASHLAMPIIVVDPEGDLLYFNEPAEHILGRRFEETEELRRGQFAAIFQPIEEDGTPIKREEQPLTIATERREPAHRRYWIRGLDGVRRLIEGTAVPLIGQNDRMLGALGIFWEIHKE